MEFFTLGNILTLGIVGMTLFLYRQIDRHSQSMHKVQKYAADLKAELTEFVADKEAAVKDYAIALDVQQKAAKELMRRLQITDEELAGKAAKVTLIDERLNAYDVSLKELIEMSVRVQENLNRIREESGFVEKVNKRVADSKEKFEAFEQGLADVERRFAAENAAGLEQIAQQVVAAVAEQVDGLRSTAEQAELRIAEGREAVERSEHIRTERIAKDMDFINRSLDEALEQAAIRANNMENAAVIKLREQAIERIHELETAIEGQLDAHLENARNQLRALQELVTDCKESWKTDAAELEGQQKDLKETWKQDIEDIQERLTDQRNSWETTVESENDKMNRLLGDVKTISDTSREHLADQTAMMEERLGGVRNTVDAMISDLEQRIAGRIAAMERQVLEANEERLINWNRLTIEADTNTRQLLGELEAASTEIKTHFTAETDAMEQRLKELDHTIDTAIASLRNQVATAGEHIEKTVSDAAADRFEQWKRDTEARDAESRQILGDIKTETDTFKTAFAAETQDMERRLSELQDQITERTQELQDQMGNIAAETQGQIAEEMAGRLDRWKEAAEEGDERSRQLLKDLETAAAESETYIAHEIEQVNGRLDNIGTKIDELVVHIESEISGAEERALSAADTELEKWKEAVEKEDAKARQTIFLLEAALEDTQQRISGELAGADKQIEGLKHTLDATASHIEVELVNAAANAKEQGLILADEELNKWKHAIEIQNSIAQNLLNTMETALADAKEQSSYEITGITERLEALQAKLEETVDRIEAELAQAGANAHDQGAMLAERELERWKQAVETEEIKVQNVLAGIELSLTDTKERISHEITAAAGQLDSLQAKLSDTASQIETAVTGALAGAQEQAAQAAEVELDKWKTAAEERDAAIRQSLTDGETALEAAKDRVSQYTAEVTEKLTALQTETGAAIGHIEEQIAQAVNTAGTQAATAAAQELERWKQHITAEDAKLREALGDLETFFTAELDKRKETVETEDARLRARLADLEGGLKNTEQDLTGEIANAQERIEHLQSKIDDTCDTIEAAMTGAVRQAEERAAELAAVELGKRKETVDAEDARLRAQLADLETALEDAKQRVGAEILETAGRFESLQMKIADTTGRIESVITETLGKAEERATELADDALDKWKNAVETEETKVRDLLAQIAAETAGAEGQFSDIQTKITDTAEQIKRIMDQAVADTESKALSLNDRGLERWKAVAEEGDRQARQLLTELETAYAETEGRFDGIQARIQETAAQIDGIMAQAVKDAEEKAHTLNDRGLDRWKSAAEEGDARARKLFADLEQVSAETKRHVFDEIAAAQGQFESLQAKIEHIAQDIEAQMAQTVNTAEEKAAALAGAGLERWKAAQEEGDAKTQALIRDLQSAVEAGSQSAIAVEERLAKIGEDLKQTAAEDAARRLEQWKQAADSAEAEIRQIMTTAEASFTVGKEHISERITEEENRIKTIESRIDEATALLESEMALAVGKAKEKALETATQEEIKMRQQIIDLDSIFREMRKQLFNEIDDAESRIRALQSRIDDTYAHIENELAQAVSKAGAQALGIAEKGLETWKTQITAEEARIRQLIEDAETGAGKIKTRSDAEQESLEQRLGDLRQYADRTMEGLKAQLDQQTKDTEQQALKDMEVRLQEWKSLTEAEDIKAQALLTTLEASSAAVEQRIQTLRSHIDDSLAALETRLGDTAGMIERKILEEADAKFEEYQTAQAEQAKRLETLADDTSGMDAELRRHMADIENRVREDFSQFERHSAEDRDKAAAEFESALGLIKTEMDAVEQELQALKTEAYQNVSDQFRTFEQDFSNSLSDRNGDIERRLAEWQETLNQKLADFMKESTAECHEQVLTELDRLKTETAGFEEHIRDQMKAADDSLASLQTQVHQDMEETRNTAAAEAQAEIERYTLSMTENLKQSQRDLEARIKTVADQAEARSREVTGMLEASRHELDTWQAGFTAELHGLDTSMGEVRRQSQELLAESENRLNSIRSALTDADTSAEAHRADLFTRIGEEVKTLDSAIKEADRRIKEFAAQTKLFERTDELKAELERRLEELRGDFDRIDQRRIEAMDLEGQFVKIKRLEDEVNAKMTRFLTEKHRIEQMETEFNRLLQVSAAVEEKLTEVSDSDDALQQIQIQLRKLNDALSDAEEKYQRIEKKNQTLDTTNDGIDRNFKSLQESEKITRHISDEVNGLTAEIGVLRSSVTGLTEENARAREIADKLSLLDTSLSTVEERIEDMQKARQWIARAETRLEELNRQILDQVKLVDGSRNLDKTLDIDKGAPPLGVRDNIIRLARQGWTADEIARAVKRSRGEVELVLEIMPKD